MGERVKYCADSIKCDWEDSEARLESLLARRASEGWTYKHHSIGIGTSATFILTVFERDDEDEDGEWGAHDG